jgi:molybdopterin molybdotransferase
MFLQKLDITGVILAGGRGSRLLGQDKGLVCFKAKPLIERILQGLPAQVGQILISANRNLAAYQAYTYPVISDDLSDFQGPLAGILSAMQRASTAYILTIPCDAPYVCPVLAERLYQALQDSGAAIAVAHDGQREQSVYALIKVATAAHLAQYLAQGERKLSLWYRQLHSVSVDFSDYAYAFQNMNTPEQKQMMEQSLPVLGFCAYSGTGKTTLLTQLIPLLKQRGLRLAVIKHTHHVIDLDKPGKDSYRMREAGAQQVVLASHQRLISLQEKPQADGEANLADALACINPLETDLVLVEGFKHANFAKIELHRPSLGKPLMYPDDANIMAVASDAADLLVPPHLHKLDLNQPSTLVDFIIEQLPNLSLPKS